jgi:hypothetical protein
VSFDFQKCLDWYLSSAGQPIDESQYCPRRDVFEGRLYRLLGECESAAFSEQDSALVVAVAGELANNSFDHNLGHWRDMPGCYFGYKICESKLDVWVADRGRGIYDSLSRVISLNNSQEAIEVAFEKVVSGRAPEKRGNGLKFVRSVINGDKSRGLLAFSGDGKIAFGRLQKEFETDVKIPAMRGVFNIFRWAKQ